VAHLQQSEGHKYLLSLCIEHFLSGCEVVPLKVKEALGGDALFRQSSQDLEYQQRYLLRGGEFEADLRKC
jgi:hypothetical protein